MNWRRAVLVVVAPFLVGSDTSVEAREAREWADFLHEWLYGPAATTETTRALPDDASPAPETSRDDASREESLARIDELQDRALRARRLARGATVYFESGAVELDERSEQTLHDFARSAVHLHGLHFQIAGHTDDVPLRPSARFRSNRDLALARAERVRVFLVSEGVPAGDLSTAAFADTAPIASNASAEGRTQNRRVELRFLPWGVVHPLLRTAP